MLRPWEMSAAHCRMRGFMCAVAAMLAAAALLLMWGIGMLLYFGAGVCETVLSFGWNDLAFRLWYWSGAMLVPPVLAQGTDSQVGTWKLNLAKSKYSPGPAPKSATTKIEAVGAGTKVIVDQAQADGSMRHWEFTANYDGKDNPITGNNPDADMVARTRINATTIQTISKKGGKVTTTQTSAVSADGKTRTVTTKGVNAAGQTVNNVAVYDRQ